MYAIENSLGRFEADSEKDAKKLLRKAQREQEKKDAIEHERYKVAIGHAYHEAYRMYELKGRRADMPRGWRIMPVDEKNYSCRRISTMPHSYQIETGHHAEADSPSAARRHQGARGL